MSYNYPEDVFELIGRLYMEYMRSSTNYQDKPNIEIKEEL